MQFHMPTTLKTIELLYTITWLSTLMVVVHSIRHFIFENDDEKTWNATYQTAKTTINVILATWLVFSTRKSRNLEGELGFAVGSIMLFLIDWPFYITSLKQSLLSTTPKQLVFLTSIMGVLVWSASAVARNRLSRR